MRKKVFKAEVVRKRETKFTTALITDLSLNAGEQANPASPAHEMTQEQTMMMAVEEVDKVPKTQHSEVQE